MTHIPATGYFSDSARTNAEAKQAQDDMLEIMRQTPGGSAVAELTIATGSVIATQNMHSIDTESDASSDILDNILQTNTPEGTQLLIRNEDNARTINVAHASTGAGEFILVDAATFVLDDIEKWLWIYRNGTQWIEIGRFYGSDNVASQTFLGLGTAAVLNSGTADANLPTNAQLKANAREFTETQNADATTLSDVVTIAWNLKINQVTSVTITADRTMGLPTNIVDGAYYSVEVIQGAGFPNLMTWNSAFKWPEGTAPTLSTTSGAVDHFVFRGVGTTALRNTAQTFDNGA